MSKKLLPAQFDYELQLDVISVIDKFKHMRGNRQIRDEEVGLIEEWVKLTRIYNSFIDLIIKGLISIDVSQDGDLTFTLSSTGEEVADVIFSKGNNV